MADARQASREASLWMIRLQEEPDDEALQREFQAWRAEQANANAWRQQERMTRAVAGIDPAYEAEWMPFLKSRQQASLWDGLRKIGRHARVPQSRRWMLQPGLLAAAACLVAILFGPEWSLRFQSDYYTGTGQSRTVALSDGSMVTLAPNSAIDVAYVTGERNVHLLEGEAFFEVVADPAAPFQVVANDVEVTVLGTGFNVRRGKTAADVGVTHGVVRVERDGAALPLAARLIAGETLRVSWSGEAELGERPASLIGAWRRDQLVAQDQTLDEIIERLRPYFGGAIFVTDSALGQQPVTGVYDLSDPMRAISGVARSQNARVRQITPWLVIISPS